MIKQLSLDDLQKKPERVRWNKHVQIIYDVLKDREYHDKQEILDATKTGNFQARIHELRKNGYLIECKKINKAGKTMYRIIEYTGKDTTSRKHCYCCRYNEDYIETKYTG
tara:strand:+ start:2057 stop:2386 length:330 start_codon:yes stop_codon:yes gene_type:complete